MKNFEITRFVYTDSLTHSKEFFEPENRLEFEQKTVKKLDEIEFSLCEFSADIKNKTSYHRHVLPMIMLSQLNHQALHDQGLSYSRLEQ